MSQLTTRMYIQVSDTSVWKRFENFNINDEDVRYFFDYELSECTSSSITQYAESGMGISEDQLLNLVKSLAKIIQKDGVIISDTENINVDPHKYCVYYFGNKVRKKLKHWYDWDNDNSFKYRAWYISDWLNCMNVPVSQDEKDYLFDYGVIYEEDGHYHHFDPNLHLPDLIYLRGTNENTASAVIEHLNLNDELSLHGIPSRLDPLEVVVKNQNEYIGTLPSDVGDQIYPLLVKDKLSYTACVKEAVPMSKRNIHAKSPIVAINITAKRKA